ncbi:MAG: ferric iron uptake transcriptional regulator [Gammaproteobacteria bacterium]|uniref:Ferric uptake regulation protein n=1 Tax=SAR86 cluster bacterium TaxID=2030880 RepID=A0A520MY66_9GAMM|nr:ferric iron uptake transcriptional regulator [Gammaproteobacteria bacterium]MBA4730276.1 ferric iron uptake transcriptional regulator [SAR86 cluster bacterium]RPG35509.1 MAG: ferric iron uptake transcriptional regulator [Gammaproteobacteria bacterium TMED193]RZO26151.1 MAG: ferric iron uptake transcriptional regulator [SAR86 cluster bacterium]|tara:strand:+ start:180 stop:584 length:405 start_codon:yes stop_codon:yes gene_type:complete
MSENTKKNLQEAGLKSTLPRLKIMEILENGSHLSAEEIYRDLITNNYDVGLATVYRVLTQFENAGIVIKHSFEASKSVYELNDHNHHDHMVCVDSGDIIEFHDEIIEARQEAIAKKHGYELVDHSMVLYVKKVK